MSIVEIKDANEECLKAYSGLRRDFLGSSFIADGAQVVMKCLKSDLKVYSVLLTSEYYNENKEKLTEISAPIYLLDKKSMQKIVGYRLHQGAMAHVEVPKNVSLQDLKAPILVLDRLTQAENIGSIIRNAHAFGFSSILLGKDCCHPYLRRCVRVGMGNVFTMQVSVVDDLKQGLRLLQEKGIEVVVCEQNTQAIPIVEASFKSQQALVLGHEYAGVSTEILGLADLIVEIQSTQAHDSLNVACASAILFHEYFKGTRS